MTKPLLKRGEQMDIAKAYIEAHPEITGNRTIARHLFQLYPMAFKDVEAARGIVRSIMGVKGVHARSPKNETTMKKHLDFRERIAKMREEYNLDFREQSDKTPYDIKWDKILVVGDLHYPYTNVDALEIAIDYGLKQGVEAIIINGDVLDFSTIAKFIAKPTDMRVGAQIDGVNEMLQWLIKSTGLPIVFHAGNHDKRIEDYMIRQAPELWHRNRLDKLLGLEDLKIDYVEEYRFMRFGKLNIAHGHHIVKGIFAPVNPARGVFIKTNCSTMINHVHRTSEHIEVDMNGKQIGCFSVGAMCDITPDYNPQVSKHQLGFAIVEKDSEGNFEVQNKKIVNGKVR